MILCLDGSSKRLLTTLLKLNLSVQLLLLPVVYYVDSEGSCVPGTFFCVGSGANLAYSVIDHSEKEMKDMDLEEAVELATWAIRHATYRDGYSGGYINVIYIDSTGIHHVKRVDSRTLNILDSV